MGKILNTEHSHYKHPHQIISRSHLMFLVFSAFSVFSTKMWLERQLYQFRAVLKFTHLPCAKISDSFVVFSKSLKLHHTNVPSISMCLLILFLLSAYECALQRLNEPYMFSCIYFFVLQENQIIWQEAMYCDVIKM